MKNDIIKVGDSLYMKVDSIDQLSDIVKFLDDSKLKKAADELKDDAEKTKGDVSFVEMELTKKMYDNGYITYNDFREAIGLPPVKRPSAQTVFNSLSPEDVEENLFDHEASLCDHEERLSHLEEDIAKLEKTVADIPKTMGKIATKMMEANDGNDKDLKSFSINMYWNYDDQGEDED